MSKGLLLDYGGTLDTDGVHWGELLWAMYQQYGVPVTKEAFRQAYVHGEKALALHPWVKPEHIFYDVLFIKLDIQFAYLLSNHFLPPSYNSHQSIASIATACDDYARSCVSKAYPVLETLANRFPIVLVSNFYGNINAVLEAYGIRQFFLQIVESSVVSVRKPDPRIFTLGVNALGLMPQECIAIGDSYRKDILPAKAAGCYTIWLKGEGWEEDHIQPDAADKIIQSFSEVLNYL